MITALLGLMIFIHNAQIFHCDAGGACTLRQTGNIAEQLTGDLVTHDQPRKCWRADRENYTCVECDWYAGTTIISCAPNNQHDSGLSHDPHHR